MKKSQRMALSATPFYASLVVIFSLALFTGAFWAFNEYEVYEESISNIRENYQNQYRDRLAEEMKNIYDFIEFKRSQTDILVESELRQKVQTAYTIASHIHRQYKDEKSTEELRRMVAEILRPIRWNNERGCYFAGRIEDKTIDLFADDPFFEGKDRHDILQETDLDVVGDIVTIIKEKGAGIYRYNWLKPEYLGSSHRKMSFVKYFKPFDWFIGAGIYIDDMENVVREDVLTQVQKMRFGLNGEVFGFRSDGTIICYHDERLIGRSIRDLTGNNGASFGQTMWNISKNSQHEGYFNHTGPKNPSGKAVQRLSYVKAFNDWDMFFVTSINMEEMEQAITDETGTYIRIAFKNAFLFVILFSIAVTCLLLVAYSYSLKIKHSISLFTNFFRNAADNKVKIEDTNLAFAEFEDLAKLANRMIEDRIHKEQLLRRDELRLDTLLRLGMMEKHSFQKKYDFILERVVRITGSKGGYLALVNASQTHLSLCSIFPAGDNAGKDEFQPLTENSLPGVAILKKQSVIVNDFADEQAKTSYPYHSAIHRHLDVPIFNDGKIVIVAGVCNSDRDYDNSDVQQVVRLLEGMWLHLLKIYSEIEMARLERQVIAVSQEERQKIGRDLHDGLGSHLSGVEMLTKVLEKKLEGDAPDKAAQLGRVRELIREAIDKTRRLAHGLYPVHIIEQGFEASIEKFITEIESLYPVKCDLCCDIEGAPLDNNTATHVYYIIREAAFNAARHGMAKHIAIIVEKNQHHLFVRIEDNGAGITETAHQKGMGLHIMKYRAKAIKATLSIHPGVEKGMVVSLTGEVQE